MIATAACMVYMSVGAVKCMVFGLRGEFCRVEVFKELRFPHLVCIDVNVIIRVQISERFIEKSMGSSHECGCHGHWICIFECDGIRVINIWRVAVLL